MTAIHEIHRTLADEFARFVSQNPNLISQIQQLITHPPESGAPVAPPPFQGNPQKAANQTLGNMVVQLENDSTVLIKVPSKPAIPYDCRQLGFRDDRAKAWRFLVDVFSDPEPTFNFGPAYSYPDGRHSNRVKNKFYDARWKLCNEACKKLLIFFSREFGMYFPPGYKLYEKVPTGVEGERRFKFQVNRPCSEERPLSSGTNQEEEIHAEYSGLEELELISEINRLNDEFEVHSERHPETPDKMVAAFRIGREKFGWSEEQMKGILSG